ncbi:MAG: DNA repair protein RecO [Candidatus Eremiobacteraeota bacterium]|nr:DNA repair protein RecO [Candidatus Eremiobacteraeota bacterium]
MTEERSYKTTAFVLRGRNLGEADKIYTLFTAARGKLDAIAKGVRRTKSHFAGRLEFMTEATLTLHRGRNLDVITSAEMVRSSWNVVVRPTTFSSAHLIVEIVNAFCEPDLAIPDVYALLSGALTSFERSQDVNPLLPRFYLRMLDALGLAPPSAQCVRCAASLDDSPAWVDLESGGLACMACRFSRQQVIEMSPLDVANFQALGAPKGGKLQVSITATATSRKAVEAFLYHHLGKRPKAGLSAGEFVSP